VTVAGSPGSNIGRKSGPLVIERRLALGLVGKRADHHHAAIA
jgi:hypothetical protein